MSSGKNRRRHRRIPYLGAIRISWTEQGSPRFAMTRCIDISEAGLRIESPYPVPQGAVLSLESERIKLRGAATVKHSIRYGSKYLLGLQLAQAVVGGTIASLENRPVVTVLIENLNRIHQKV